MNLKNILFVFITAFLSFTSCKAGLLFYPSRHIVATPEETGLEYKSVYFITKDKVRLNGWWIPSNRERGTVLFCHGNAGNISHRLDSFKIFNGLNLNVFIFDYRGYGKSGGAPSEEGTYQDVKSAWKYLVENKKIKPDKIIVFGRSLGGPIATWLAQKYRPGILIIESTFTSASEVAEHHYKWFPSGAVFGDTYSTDRYIKNVKCPVLVIHSREDEIIPYRLGKKLFNLANGPKAFVTIHGSHNSGFIISLNKYQSALDSFISRYLVPYK